MQNEKSHNLLWGRGVTLVEMVVAISLMTVALTAMVPLLRSIQNSWDSRQGAAEVLQNGRVLSDHLYRQLATAIQITDVSGDSDASGYIEFVDGDGVTRRYETGADGYVQFGAVGGLSDLAGPVSRFQFACYDGNDFSTPTVDADAIRFVSNRTTYTNTSNLGSDKTLLTNVFVRSGPIGDDETAVDSHIAVKDDISVSGSNPLIDSYRSSAGSYDAATAGSEAVISTNDDADSSILIWNSATVRGDAYIGPDGSPDDGIVVSSTSDLTGEKGALEAAIDIPSVSAPTNLNRYNSGSNGRGNGQGRGHGNGQGQGHGNGHGHGAGRSIELSGTSTETLSADWEVHGFLLEGSSTLTIEGDVTLVVTDTFEMRDSAELEIAPDSSLTLYVAKTFDATGYASLNRSTQDPSRLRIYMTGNNRDFTVEDNAVVYGVLDNPRGTIEILDDAEFFGKLRAEDLECTGKIHVDLDCTFDAADG